MSESLEVYVPLAKRNPRTLTMEELVTQNELLRGDVRAAEKNYERLLETVEQERPRGE